MQIYHKILRQVQEGVFACFSPGSRAIDYEEMLMIVCGAGISEGEADSSSGCPGESCCCGENGEQRHPWGHPDLGSLQLSERD